MWNLPNILTLLRIVLIPVFVVVFYLDSVWAPYAAAAVFGAAALTDWLDGYLARKWNQTSPLGAFLDPVADKLMVAVALVVLLQADPRILIALPVIVIIGREITVSALREWMAEIGARAAVAVSALGKIKTTAQMISIVILILRDSVFGPWTYGLGVVLLYVAALLTLWSMVLYLLSAWPSLSGRADRSNDSQQK
ncbi:CDP-diacylglycerol--glycerol-3-phosphate 3-phosphatidyltransferase [Allochromatium vinosum]|uniref:CDP-diacylglycerol--glycerol-3-phosphate 3-phosphatidyltransferase n=1 Tax=Allochromatium vinosum TaxID=1049 RepID=UPI001905543C|nr:CDP-diacylglycerol--glycerol-3-phosphate 3-phosphatidyltransferase [Allochromatium vinosum]MBK1653118.1 CDP-diacylglycerol--glycerol-3-phosphate 3-phosphatidyltransferase [Allochromatium vinosum]